MKDTAIAGGKGASLGEMTRAGIPVPPGFVVLTKAFEAYIEETNIDVEIDEVLFEDLCNDKYSYIIHRSFGGDGVCIFVRIKYTPKTEATMSALIMKAAMRWLYFFITLPF